MEISRVQLHWDLGAGKRREVSSAGALPYKDFPLHHLAAEGEFTSALHPKGIAVSGNEVAASPLWHSQDLQHGFCSSSLASAGRHLGCQTWIFTGNFPCQLSFSERDLWMEREEEKEESIPERPTAACL